MLNEKLKSRDTSFLICNEFPKLMKINDFWKKISKT